MGQAGDGDGEMHVPYGIDVDADGNVWLLIEPITEWKNLISHGKFIIGNLGNQGCRPWSI